MKKINATLPEWIERYAALGAQADLDDGIEFTENERLWYLLTLFVPMIFESYAVVLHPFWILKDHSIPQWDNRLLPESDKIYEPTTWVGFFSSYNKEFILKTSLATKKEIQCLLLANGKWPSHTRFPAEGDMENSQAQQIRDTLLKLYGDISVNYYYCLLKTKSWEKDVILSGRLSELETLWSREDIRDNPSAIYPNSKDWCIITDYDSQMTYVGGCEELISRLTKLSKCDIYQLEPKSSNK
jgi:hypothetical protein